MNEQDKEEIKQEYELALLQGSRQPFRYFVIDYLRKRSGRKGTRSYSTRQNLWKADQAEQDFNFIQTSFEPNLESRLDFIKYSRAMESLKKRDREIMNLILEGYGQTEISDIYRVSTSRVHQILKRIQSCLHERVEEEASHKRKRQDFIQELVQFQRFIFSFKEIKKMAIEESRKMELYYGQVFSEWTTQEIL